MATVDKFTTPESGTYYALYMGSTYVTDPQEKNALKMAARMVLEQEADFFRNAAEVNVQLLEKQVKVIRRRYSHPQEQYFLKFPYSSVSACFILRENTKIVSIGVGQPNGTTNAHVFMLITSQTAEQMVADIIQHFNVPASGDAKPADAMPTDTVERPKSAQIQREMASVCLLDW